MKNRSPLTIVGIFLIALSAYVLIYLTVTESFLGTIFPTGIAAIIIGAIGVKLVKTRMKQKEQMKRAALEDPKPIGENGR
jgi:uncharacterized membrane protein YjjB (DUF3815 family)